MKHYEGEKWEFDDEKLTPLKAIKKMCLQCMCGDYNAVKECGDLDCPVHQYRLGHGSKIKKRELSEEEKKVRLENMRRGREKIKMQVK